MKYKELQIERVKLRKEYESTPTQKTLELGISYKKMLDTSKGCYNCDEVIPKEGSAFCSEKCKDEYWKDSPRPKLTIDQMREKLKQMAIEAKRKEVLA